MLNEAYVASMYVHRKLHGIRGRHKLASEEMIGLKMQAELPQWERDQEIMYSLQKLLPSSRADSMSSQEDVPSLKQPTDAPKSH
jgi:hypothetical protein